MLATPEMPPAAPSPASPVLHTILEGAATILATPPPTRPPRNFHAVFDTAKSLWSGAVSSGLAVAALAWLGDLPKEGHAGWWVFLVTLLISALRTGLRLWQSGPDATVKVTLGPSYVRPELTLPGDDE